MRISACIPFLVFIAAPGALADEISGVVVSVTDGNTITLRVDQKKISVRLAGIYAPDSRQTFGLHSRISLAKLCHSKSAAVRKVGQDRAGRIIGRVSCNGINANAEQARRGWAWVYERDASPDSLHVYADDAKAQRRGLWVDQAAVSPWEWRKNQGGTATASLQ